LPLPFNCLPKIWITGQLICPLLYTTTEFKME
jgi:hypothetical protein